MGNSDLHIYLLETTFTAGLGEGEKNEIEKKMKKIILKYYFLPLFGSLSGRNRNLNSNNQYNNQKLK